MSSMPSQRLPRWRLVRGALQQRGSPPPPAAGTGSPLGDLDEEAFEPLPPLELLADDLPPDFIDELGLGPDPSMPHVDEGARPAVRPERAWRLGPRVVELNLADGTLEPPARLRRLPHALFNPPKTDLG